MGTPGAPGTPGADNVGVTAGEDAADDSDVPDPFVAVDVNVYAVPFVNPVTAHDVAGTLTTQVAPPGAAVTR